MERDYHHGSLRQAVIDRAVEVIAGEGPGRFSLRSLATDLGVSHTAPRHHFGSREGVLTAVAAEGFRLLGERLRTVPDATDSLLDAGVAYVAFAFDHPAHFEVMFSPSLTDRDDPELTAARAATFAVLRGGVDAMERTPTDDEDAAVLAAWGLVHGIATLALSGSLAASELGPSTSRHDLLDLTRRTASRLYSTQPTGVDHA